MKNYVVALQIYKDINVVVQAESEQDAYRQVSYLEENNAIQVSTFGELNIIYEDASEASDEMVEKHYTEYNFDRVSEPFSLRYRRVSEFAKDMIGKTPEDLRTVFKNTHWTLDYDDYMQHDHFSIFEEILAYDIKTNTFKEMGH